MASKPIYQIYAELQDYKPKIWRKFQVMNDITMARLAYILMTLFEMQASHLYKFEVNERNNFIINNLEYYNKYLKEEDEQERYFKIAQYGCMFEDNFIISEERKEYKELQDAKDVKLKYVLKNERETAEFQYDFGDNWLLTITVEKIFEDDTISGKDLPRVIDGEGFGIIENCGGTGGLEDIRKAFKTKKGKDYEMYSNWLGVEKLDLDKCDLEDLNFRLKKLPRIFRESYEYGLEPTDRSIKLLERDYKK